MTARLSHTYGRNSTKVSVSKDEKLRRSPSTIPSRLSNGRRSATACTHGVDNSVVISACRPRSSSARFGSEKDLKTSCSRGARSLGGVALTMSRQNPCCSCALHALYACRHASEEVLSSGGPLPSASAPSEKRSERS